MKKLVLAALLSACACASHADLVTHYLKLDTAKQDQPFETTITRGSTPLFRIQVMNNNAAVTNLSGYGVYLYYATNAMASSGVRVQGSATTNNTNGYAYIQFTSNQALGIYSNSSEYPATFWAQVVVTNSTGKVYDWSQGRVRIRPGGAVEGAATVVLNGAESDPVFGSWLATNVQTSVDSVARGLGETNAVDIASLTSTVASNSADIANVEGFAVTNAADIAELQSTVVTSVVCSGQTYNESFFTLSYSPSLDSAATNESYTISTNLDTVLRTYALDVTSFQSIPSISVLANRSTNSIIVTSTNGTNATVDANGVASFTATNATITATLSLGSFSRTTNLSAQTSYGTTNTIAITGVAGSYRQAICAWVDARTMSGLTTTVFSTYSGATTNYVRNTNCWIYGADITCASPWNSTGGTQRAGTLITPQHVVFATHYPLPVGTVMHFVDLTNAVEVRTVTAASSIANADVSIALLNSALPTNRFTPAAILPSSYTSSVPTIPWDSYGLPAITIDREEKASCRMLNQMPPANNAVSYSIPSITNRYAYYDIADGGDSGSPTFVIVSNSPPVLLSVWTTAITGGSLTYYASQVQYAINALGGTATNLTYADLSVYNTY